MKIELADGVILYRGDNASFMAEIQGEFAIVADPPYGQKQKTNIRKAGGLRAVMTPRTGARAIRNVVRIRNGEAGIDRSNLASEWPDGIVGDDKPFDPAPWLDISPHILFWGAHVFSDRLPAGSWLIWDKVPTGKIRDQGDGEAAWMSGPIRPMRIYRLLWDGACVGAAARDEVTAGQRRVHPTQKPVALMKWCIAQMRLPPGTIIVDPYMGSGATGIAAVQLGLPFVGMEIVPQYFDTSVRRIGEALQQSDMFITRQLARAGA
jgi:site-specific DNA-methyltransferase (adenine-specific)